MKTSYSWKWLAGAGLAAVLIAAPSLHAGAVDVEVLESTPDRVVLHYTFDSPTAASVEIDGQKHTELSLAGEAVTKEVGAPAVPLVARSVIVGDVGIVSLNILDAEYQEVASAPVAPSKGFILRTIDPATVPYQFGPAYGQDAFYPATAATLRTPFIQRDYRGVVVLTHPAQYNPARGLLRVYSSLTVEVVTKGTGGLNELDRGTRSGKVGPSFDMIYRHRFLNYAQEGRYDPLDEEGNMLVICYDDWLENVQPLVNHRNTHGIPTTLVPVSTAGSSSTAIKNYIEDVYDSSDLAFVLLVGDVAQVPTPYSSGGASDPTYSKLAGGDDYPEIMVGRFSAQTSAQVDTQVERTVEYEMTHAPTTEWFWKGIGIASNQGPGDDGEDDDEHIDLIRDWLMDFGYTEVDQVYDPSATATMVTNGLNDGRGIINYCGHGWIGGWSSSGYSISDVDNLINDNMLPFITSVACNTGEFDGGTCFGEAWLRATHDGEPTGAIGFYGSSISQSWSPPMEGQDEFNLLLTSEAYVSYGALCFAGSCSMMDQYGSGGVSEFDCWHIFGDPALRVGDWTMPGDTNCSGIVDFFDVSSFVLAITNPAEYEAQNPDCDIRNADCNGDGVVNFFDVDAFVELVTGP